MIEMDLVTVRLRGAAWSLPAYETGDGPITPKPKAAGSSPAGRTIRSITWIRLFCDVEQTVPRVASGIATHPRLARRRRR